MIELVCDYCGKPIKRFKSTVKKHNFCSRECLANYSSKQKNPDGYSNLKSYKNMSKHMSELNRELNPSRMTLSTREKLRLSKIKDDATSYPKFYGRHEHRVVAEKKLGRKLRDGEVVHHIDGNKRNNDPDNLMVFSSQAEHASYHLKLKRGDATCCSNHTITNDTV